MKSFILFLALFLTVACTGQDLNLNNLNYTNSSFGLYAPNNINLGGTNNLAIGSGVYSLQAGNVVHIPPYTHISTTSSSVTGFFNAKIINKQLDAVILEPSNVNAVPIFSKVEIGINIPSLDTRIKAFLDDTINGLYKPGTNAYSNAFYSGSIINPYDPQQISVDVVFYKPNTNGNGVIRHGFYYKNVTSNVAQTDWNDPLPADREWRVRFAPDQTGLWTGTVFVYIGNQLLDANNNFSFTVVSSTNPGFVQKGPNPRYLQFSGSGDSFIPVGNGYAWPISQDTGNCSTLNCNLGYRRNNNDHRISRNALNEMTNFLNQLTASGGNSSRLLMSVFGFQIENEKLGNYDTRQIEMSVLDDYLKLLEQKGVRIILGQLTGDMDPASNQNPASYTEGWSGNPYNGLISSQPSYPNYKYKGIAGISLPRDIFNPSNSGYAQALQFMKNRWRYIDARWGYSTSIYTYELMTELHCDSLWFADMETNVAAWCNEIGRYLKQDLGSRQLTTVTYGNGDYNPLGDNPYLLSTAYPSAYKSKMWDQPNIDIITGHVYNDREANQRFHLSVFSQAISLYPSKPVYHNEYDAGYFDLVTLCTDRTFHNLNWGSIFSGMMGPGLSWHQRRYNYNLFSGSGYTYKKPYLPNRSNQRYDSDPNAYRGEYEKNYPALKSYINQIDFKNTTYNYYSLLEPNVSTDPSFELLYMVSSDKSKAYGWAHNRSFNAFNDFACYNNDGNYPNISNFRENPHTWDDDSNPSLHHYFKRTSPQASWGFHYNEDNYVTVFGTGYSTVSKSSTNVKVKNLLASTSYNVVWVWTWGTNGGQNATAYNSTGVSNSSGELTVTVPPTGTVGGTLYPGDWAFKIIKNPPRPTGIGSLEEGQIRVSPNPSANVFVISGVNGEIHGNADIHVLDLSGRLLYKEAVADINNYSLNLQNYDNGVYLLKVLVNSQETILRLIKNSSN